MNLLLLFSYVNAGLNFADSIYSAVFFLSKTVSIYPLFPIIDEIAFYNQDKTIDYSTLIYGAENKYDAINAYETLLYMHFPEVMTEEQKGNLTKSLYFIKDVESLEVGSYCRAVYERIHRRYGTYLNLEPLSPATTELEASFTPDTSSKDEIIFEKRSNIDDDVMSVDIVEWYLFGSDLITDTVDSLIEKFRANLLGFRTIGLGRGVDIFQYSSLKIVSEASRIEDGEAFIENDPQSDFKSKQDEARENFEKSTKHFASIFKDARRSNGLIQRMVNWLKKVFGFEYGPASFMTLNCVTSTSKIHGELNKMKNNPVLKNLNLWQTETLKTTLMAYYNIEFASEFVNPESTNTQTFLSMADIYKNDPSIDYENILEMIDVAIKVSGNTDIYDEITTYLDDNNEIAITKFLLHRLKNEFSMGSLADDGVLMHNINLLNMMSFLTSDNYLGFEVEGVRMHEFKQGWLVERPKYTTKPLPRNLVEALDKLKTPVDRLQDQIDTLVSDSAFVAASGLHSEDPVEFFKINQRTLKKLANNQRINLILKSIVNSLSNISKDHEVGEDIGEISLVLIGNGINDHGVIGESSNPAFRSAAKRLRRTPKSKDRNYVKSNVYVKDFIRAKRG